MRERTQKATITAELMLLLGEENEMTRITDSLELAIMKHDIGRVTKEHLLQIFQDCIDNGDILEPANELYFAAIIMPFIDRGVLTPSTHTKQLEHKMNSTMTARVDQIRKRVAKKKPFWKFW